MRDQFEAEQIMEAIDHENAKKVEEQTERIQNLEQQLNSLAGEASNEKGAADILRQWIDSGEVVISDNGMPNIIRNREDLVEEQM